MLMHTLAYTAVHSVNAVAVWSAWAHGLNIHRMILILFWYLLFSCLSFTIWSKFCFFPFSCPPHNVHPSNQRKLNLRNFLFLSLLVFHLVDIVVYRFFAFVWCRWYVQTKQMVRIARKKRNFLVRKRRQTIKK